MEGIGTRRRVAETELDDSVAEEVTPRCVMSTDRLEYAQMKEARQGGIEKKMRSYAMFPTFLTRPQESPGGHLQFRSDSGSAHTARAAPVPGYFHVKHKIC